MQKFESISAVERDLFALPFSKLYQPGCVAFLSTDRKRRLFGIACFSWDEAMPYTCSINALPAGPSFTRSFFFSTTLEGVLFAHILWFAHGDDFNKFSLRAKNGQEQVLLYCGTPVPHLNKRHVEAPKPPYRHPPWVFLLTMLLRLSGLPRPFRLAGRKRFAGCWLFADRGFRPTIMPSIFIVG